MAVPDLEDAISHLQQKNPDAAIAALEKKIDELPAHLTAHVLLARAYEAKQQWTDALTSWENVRFLMPNSPVAREGKERVLRHLRKGDAAPSSSSPAPADTVPSAADSTEAATSSSDTEAAPDTSGEPPVDADPPDTTDDAEDTDESADTPEGKPPQETPSEEEPSTATPDDSDAPDSSPDPAPSKSKEKPTTASEAVSELEQLRRQAEEEARQGGARAAPGGPTPDADSSPDDTPESTSVPDAPTAPDTPEERVREMNEDDDLERLIDELESARIEPNPDVEEVPTPDLDDDVDDIVSETLARIHEAQDQYRKAAQIYVKLASQEPDQARTYLQKASEMRERAEAQSESENADS